MNQWCARLALGAVLAATAVLTGGKPAVSAVVAQATVARPEAGPRYRSAS